MSGADTVPARAGPAVPAFRRFLGRIGAPVVAGLLWLVRLAAMGSSVVFLAMRRTTWRRTVRAEFGRAIAGALVGPLTATAVTAVLVGVGLVYQALYWLEAAGQVEMLGRIIVIVLIRELAPMLVGLIIIGQSGTVMLIEITQMRAGGQLRMLDSQGIDPFLLLVVPRTLAFTLAAFTLTIWFVVITLFAGYAAATLMGAVKVTFWGYLDVIMRGMRLTDFLLLPTKSLAIGFVVGVVCSYTALLHVRSATRVVAIGFVRAAVAVFAASGLVSLIL
ncbi:MAG: ABC transporter permease [Alphaproteobacteria bacterium]|nr:ABC transporter permease [Alphaproteobacteria bacterium]